MVFEIWFIWEKKEYFINYNFKENIFKNIKKIQKYIKKFIIFIL